MNWVPSKKSKFAGVGKSRKTFNLDDSVCEKLALKSLQTKKHQGEIVDELIEKFVDEIQPRKNQFKGSGFKKETIDQLGMRCQKCGASAKDVKLHIDHIAPSSLFPDLNNNENNLQILCKYCNLNKGNKYIKDYR